MAQKTGAPIPKQARFEEWMKGDHVLLHVDSRKADVQLPAHLVGNHSLTLKLSYLFHGETTHNETAITSYLRFHGEYFCCVIPWDAVWGMTSEKSETVVWPESLPMEVVASMIRSMESPAEKATADKKEGSASEETAPEKKTTEQKVNDKQRGGGFLRRIK